MTKHNIFRIRFGFTVMLITGLLVTTNLFANVKLPAIFSDNMVLQQRTKVAFWGWADAGEMIKITGNWSANSVSVRADASGNWKVMMKTPKAGGPFTININGQNSIVLKDVLIGEVWVCSGQSNMVMSLKASDNGKEEGAIADNPSIRYFSVSRQHGSKEFNDCPGSVWKKTTPSTAPSFSAVAYYFAKKINQELKVPVGIIYAAWGGTPAEAWTPATVFKSGTLSIYNRRWDEVLQNIGKDSLAYNLDIEKYERTRKMPDSGKIKKPEEPRTVMNFKRPWREPAVLFNGMINPVIPFGIKGFLWYQGESNVNYADEYALLFGSMIESWRDRWKQDNGLKDLPFYFVQLPPFGYSNLDAGARVREAQDEVSKKLKNTGMAVTIDVGNMKDIHPTRKKEVGDRLAFLALNKTYGFKNILYAGPVVKKAKSLNNQVTVEFDQENNTVNKQQVGGFEIGYKKQKVDTLVFVPAQSRIEGNKIIVWNEEVQNPVMVRYAWLQIGEANLVNKQGLPTAPFSKFITN